MGNLAEVKQRTQSTEIVTVQDFMTKQKDLIARVLPKTITPERMLGIFNMILKSTPALAKCSQESLIGAVIQTAQLGLTPGNIGHVHLVPFWNGKKKCNEVQLICGYKGLLELVNRSGQATIMTSEVVHEKDYFEYELGLNPKLSHKPAVGDRGGIIGVYCIAKNLIANEKVFVYLQKEEVEKIKEQSLSKVKDEFKKYSPWVAWEDAMYKKTAVRNIVKLLPLSVESQKALSADETIKTKIDGDMANMPDETDWTTQEAEDAEISEPEPEQSHQEERPHAYYEGDVFNAPKGAHIESLELLVQKVGVSNTGKSGMTFFNCITDDNKTIVIRRWGKSNASKYKDCVCTFKDITVDEWEGEKQFMCKEVLV